MDTQVPQEFCVGTYSQFIQVCSDSNGDCSDSDLPTVQGGYIADIDQRQGVRILTVAWTSTGSNYINSGGFFPPNPASYGRHIAVQVVEPITVTSPGSIGGFQVVCSSPASLPSTLTSMASAVMGAGGKYQWQSSPTGDANSFVNITTGIYNQSTYSPPILSQTTYYRRAAVGRCSATPIKYSNVVYVFVNELDLPYTPSGAPSGGDFCVSGPTQVWFVAGAPSGATDVRWYSTPTGGIPLYTGSGYQPTLTQTTTFYAEAYNASTGCVSSTRRAMTATINQLPTEASGNDVYSCWGSAVTLTASPGSNGTTIRWYGSATGESPIRTGTSYTVSGIPGSAPPPPVVVNQYYYAASYNSNTGCEATTRKKIKITRTCSGGRTVSDDLNLTTSLQSLEIYPNPTHGAFNVSVNDGAALDSPVSLNYKIIDQTGRLVKSGSINSEDQVDIEDLKSGLYMVSLKAEGISKIMRLIKE